MNDRCIPNPDVVGRVDTTFTTLDQQRTQELERLQQIQSVQDAAMRREQQRLIAKYGEDHPRVQKVTARLTYNQGMQRDLSQEVERSKIDVPQLDRNTWKGHGLVLNQDQVGIPNLTISFVDEQNNWIRELGYACTDDRGYFSLLYPKQTTETPLTPDFPPIFLTVTNVDRQVLHRESTSRTVKLGQVDFWRIVLGEDRGGTCDPPDNPDPSPGKAVQVQSLEAPEQLTVNQSGDFSAQINDDATPPITSRWDFGDGSTADGLTATHAYTKPGTYTVTFSASNPASKDTRTAQVIVREVPPKSVQILTLDAPTSLPVNQKGVFTAQINRDATPPITARWEFGNGMTAEGLTVSHAYPTPGTYTITLTVANAGGKDSRSQPIAITQTEAATWTVRGQVLQNPAGQAAVGVVVALLDPQNRLDPKRLGSVTTDEKGNYTIAHTSDSFPELFETRPELLVRVRDRQGTVLFTTDKPIRCTPGGTEIVNITLRGNRRPN